MLISLVNELKEAVTDKEVSWLRIRIDVYEYEKTSIVTDNIEQAYKKFVDVMYDNGYGVQEVHGHVVFKDGTWLEREDYEGKESWVHKECPKRPGSIDS